ncbi:hypothetical protein PC9H_002910 [Pleurotus ostreatus]|uniref:Uncharacterized protein n=2 Tax=Pleurotus ostreatus TaxID=5322 RepID=A0A8H7DTD8_PLEOS|nr:uncharacterized protein PC9H_002910 [Pleurotus ostreatus]KAF7436084.1 hypothetical protein PC9H_002910 [Pleurotus ostreatus]KAJ8701708.1 hypothetical protein PTI98_000467 [Pleurotus ostreatus]
MHMSVSPLVLLPLTILAPLVSAVRYAGFASTVSCSGANFFCDDGGAVCCSLPTGFGFSVEFDNLPAGTQGQGYTGDTCGDFLFSVFGPDTKCWNGGGVRATHMNWFHSPQNTRRNFLPARADNSTCAPSGFTYHDESSTQKTIQVPLGEANMVAESYHKRDFAKLASYAVY